MHILLSNDDGYAAEGLRALAAAVSSVAAITVVAPEQNCSGASNALTLRNALRVRTADNGFLYVAGTPADCVHLAITGMLDTVPDMVISGINAGANMGDDVMYSGTVAAAIEGRFLGLPAVAISLAGTSHYTTAAQVMLELLQRLQGDPLPPDTILNINVPDCPYRQLTGWAATRTGARHQSQPISCESRSAQGTLYRIGPVGDESDAGPGTDFHAVAQNQVSVTPLQIDMTRHSALPAVRQWLAEISPA